jgi:hypothetical protein
LTLPTSNFFRGLLHSYKFKLFHLNLNSIVHISIFVHLSEAFLGIQPYFNLFRFFFQLKLQPDANHPKLVGGAGFQLRQNLADNYLEYSTPDSLPGWHAMWFYIGNLKPGLLERVNTSPKI